MDKQDGTPNVDPATLAIMNGKFIGEATDPDSDGLLFMAGKAVSDYFSLV